MDFSTKACDWTKGTSNVFLTGKSDCIVIGVFESQSLTGAGLEIDDHRVGDLVGGDELLAPGEDEADRTTRRA